MYKPLTQISLLFLCTRLVFLLEASQEANACGDKRTVVDRHVDEKFSLLGHRSWSHVGHRSIQLGLWVSCSIWCVRKKRDQNVFCSIFYKTRAILIEFGIQFPEYIVHDIRFCSFSRTIILCGNIRTEMIEYEICLLNWGALSYTVM